MDLHWKLADTLGQRPPLVIWETLLARDTADWYSQGSTCTELAALSLSFAEGCDLIDQAVLNLLYDVRRFLRVTTNASRHFRRVTLQRDRRLPASAVPNRYSP